MGEMNSSINNLIGTFATINTGSYVPIANNLVCIDTSNNRIGVNTIDPSYSIHVLGSGVDGIIASTGLKVDHEVSGTTKIIFKNLPTESDELEVGQLWNDDGILKIKQ
jgi:hypothetical protein